MARRAFRFTGCHASSPKNTARCAVRLPAYSTLFSRGVPWATLALRLRGASYSYETEAVTIGTGFNGGDAPNVFTN